MLPCLIKNLNSLLVRKPDRARVSELADDPCAASGEGPLVAAGAALDPVPDALEDPLGESAGAGARAPPVAFPVIGDSSTTWRLEP